MHRLLLLPIVLVLIVVACNNKPEAPAKPVITFKQLSETDSAVLAIGDTAEINISYPQGTNFYQYSLVDSFRLVQQVHHEVREGKPDEAGGSMGETFLVKAIRPGITIIQLVDRSAGAMIIAHEKGSCINLKS